MIGRRAALALPSLLLAGPALAVPSEGLVQGGLVRGRVTPGTRLALDGRALRVGPGGEYAFGFGRDHAAEAVLALTAPGGRTEQRRLTIARRDWPMQRITGLPPAQVTPDPEALRRITAERERLAAARATDSARVDFATDFLLPAHGRISGVFGSQRILNGEPRQPHFGFDIAAPTGTPIRSIAPGQVVLAADFFFFGRLVVIDHGHGVNSLYAHMSEQTVAEGERIGAGQRIGAVGATGRVTGPHLHFGLSWYSTWLDAQPVLPAVTG
ncbi:M23 family metallopeptidase [Belnapia rosea]|uniref:M23 family metallopeptidase n=1 Tax=Belnapia rosea TaxID=938405 RepID=UPI00088DCE46|nr:M23 family metallopeptidase [Belnapia rosea]SDB67764.1 Murein DD-endopeptidase MepM and murein hydrolase activator NlpD, contain LysM domain [Belnapia rosea]